MTPEEEKMLLSDEPAEQMQSDAITEMAMALANASSLEQMRAAAKAFLEQTEL